MPAHDEKPFSKFINALSSERLVQFTRLSEGDIPQISKFLNSIWSQFYGKTGSPVFHEDYLRWVLGGPNKDKHRLFGAFIQGNLVAYQSMLCRTLSCCGEILSGFLHTHLAVSPTLDLRQKMDCGYQMGEQSILFHPKSSYYEPSCDLIYGYVEEAKQLKVVGDKLFSKYFNIERTTCSTFQQFSVLPQRLKTFCEQNPLSADTFLVRTANREDIEPLTTLFNQCPDGPHLIMQMTSEELEHYLFSCPSHNTAVLESHDGLHAFIHYYPLETIKAEKKFLYIIIEFFVVDHFADDSIAALAALLSSASDYAKRINAKGIVLENATYLPYETYRPMGLMPTFRRMNMVFASRENCVTYEGPFRCDVK